MKIYIASKFENRMNIRELIKKFNAAGHTITRDWTRSYPPPKATKRLKLIIMQVIAQQDLQGLVEADAIVYVPPGNRGAVGELTAGIALNKYCFILGKRDMDCMPQCHPDIIVCDSLAELLTYLYILDNLVDLECPLK